MLTCILLYADMSFYFYNACQHTGECMSTCNQNFNMHVNKKFMSTYQKMHVNMHVNIQENACQHTFEISTCMSIKSTCQHTKNTCQHTEECMSTCIRNFNMHIKKITCQYTKKCMSTCIFFRTCISKKIACQHTASFPDERKHVSQCSSCYHVPYGAMLFLSLLRLTWCCT
jgi:hypothetical protein